MGGWEMSDPSVPFNPEPMDRLQARYKDAIRELIDPRDILAKKRKPPSSDARHVFDTEDGLRLIISLERMPDGRVVIHMSASFTGLAIGMNMSGAEEATHWIVSTFQQISGTSREPELLGVTDGGIPHWLLERGH
jgi:hypothetical protein